MTLIVEPLLDVPAPPRELRLYRAILLERDGSPGEEFVPDPEYARPDSGRWATDAGTLYTATREEVTWSEYCRWFAKDPLPPPGAEDGIPRDMISRLEYVTVGPPPPARALVRLDFRLERVPDLTLQGVRSRIISAGFDPTHLRGEDHRPCQELAKLAERLGWEAMIVPSAAWTGGLGTCVPIFRAGRARIVDRAVVASRVLPSVLQALDTNYRPGERPHWLRFR